ncbi:MAG: DUF2630 family protein [Acidobacteriota bacterium]
MNDSQNERGIMHHIETLVAEEHRLLGKGGLDDHEKAALNRAKVELDQCWDLLRQRRAKREFGDNPAEASVRPVSVVEEYEG